MALLWIWGLRWENQSRHTLAATASDASTLEGGEGETLWSWMVDNNESSVGRIDRNADVDVGIDVDSPLLPPVCIADAPSGTCDDCG